MVMTKTRRRKTKPVKKVQVKDPMLFLEAMGIVKRGGFDLVSILDPYFREVLGPDYRTRYEKITTRELRKRIGKHMKPGEKLSDLIIQMRAE
ncbi:MAG: hypothetical protein A2Z03_03010 [Chloroflexi bacterium RBG_16_56_8]|nr:MAG: hypothetical protein A2Z03_03010 [Chloroflexi bacterium RBG_16_56_8]